MSLLYACSFDHYGPAAPTAPVNDIWHIGTDLLLGDGWSFLPTNSAFIASIYGSYSIGAPAWGARAGDYALIVDSADFFVGGSRTRLGTESLRLPFPGASQTTRLIHFAFSVSQLPAFPSMTGFICDFLSSAGTIRGTLMVDASGRLVITDGSPLTTNHGALVAVPVTLLSTAAPVIQAQTWYSIGIEITTSAVLPDTDIKVYLGDIVPANKVLEGFALAFSDTPSQNIDILGFLPASFTGRSPNTGDSTQRAIRDVALFDTLGARNNALPGQIFVSAQEIRQEDAGGGWIANPRQHIGDGVLDAVTHSTGLRCADAAELEIGAGDFTLEAWVRFDVLPAADTSMELIAKWRAADNKRSYRLSYYGSDNTLRWGISTTGVDEIVVKAMPWVPITDRWYHVAVSRAAGQTMMFINGTQLGVPLADANTYYNGTGALGIGARFDSTTTLITTSVFKGWMDEVRLTIGVSRYGGNFTPDSDPFPREGVGDPSWASVVLLLGFDNLSLADESPYGRTMTVGSASSPVAAIQPDDLAQKHNVLNERPSIDDTYIEAPQEYAEGIFTFDALPINGETMTIGSKTYRWVDALALANDIKIGVDIPECIDNAIAAVNAGAGEGTKYGNGTVANSDALALVFQSPQFSLRALAVGAVGNSVATTDTMLDGFFMAATLTGGADIPADSLFAMERLPIDVTGVLAIQVTNRHYKTDAGAALMRVDLAGPGGAEIAGAAQQPDLSPAWAHQIFETDPDTGGGITPSTIIGGRLRFKRTT